MHTYRTPGYPCDCQTCLTCVLNLILIAHLAKTCACHTCSTHVLNLILTATWLPVWLSDVFDTRVEFYTYLLNTCLPVWLSDPLPALCPQRSASSSVRTAGAAWASTSASAALASPALSVRSVSIPLLLVTLHWHSVSDPSVYPCCWLLFTGTRCQIRQYTLAVGYSSLALSVRSVSIPLLLVTLHRHSDPSVYPCCYSSLALSVRSVSIRLLLFTGTQCQIRQYTLAVGYSSQALSVRSVSTPLLLFLCHAPHCGPSVTSHASILYIMLSFTLAFLVLFSHSEL